MLAEGLYLALRASPSSSPPSDEASEGVDHLFGFFLRHESTPIVLPEPNNVRVAIWEDAVAIAEQQVVGISQSVPGCQALVLYFSVNFVLEFDVAALNGLGTYRR